MKSIKKFLNTTGPLSLVILATLASPYAMADDNDAGWYFGVNAGRSKAKIDDTSIINNLTGTGLTAAAIVDEDVSHGHKIFGGYQFNKNLAVEGGYFDLGQFGYTLYTSPPGTLSGNVKLKGYNLDVVGLLPVTEKFSLLARLGLDYAEARASFNTTGAGTLSRARNNANKSDTKIKYGVGMQYALTESLGLRVEAERYQINDAVGHNSDVDFLSAGLLYRFGKTTVREANDTTAPFVTLVSPYKSTTNVPVNRPVRVSFSEPMDDSTVNDKTVLLQQGSTPVTGKVASPSKTTASFFEANDLAPDTLYTARVTTGVKDVAGNAMQKDYVWTFKTAPVSDSKVVVIHKFVMLEDTNFKIDSTSLSPAGEDILDQNAKIMKDNPDLKVRIAGYASASGTTEYNQDLSERRAAAVVDYMVNKGGVAAERFATIGYGETRPAIYEEKPSQTHSDAAKANMRVLFEVIAK